MPVMTGRRIQQFRLRTLLLAMLVLGPLLGWGGPRVFRAVQEWRRSRDQARPAVRHANKPTYYHVETAAPPGEDWETNSSFPESEPPHVR